MKLAGITSALCLSLLWMAGAASMALAGWSPATNLGSASSTPVIGFAPTGDAELAFDSGGVTVLVRHPYGSGFSDPQPTGVQAAGQVVLPGGGETVLRTGATIFVEGPGATSFGAPQSLGGAQEGDLSAPDAVLIPTLRGEVIASVSTSREDAETAILPRGGSVFGPVGLPPLYPQGGPVPIAADTAGGAYLVGESDHGGCDQPSAANVTVGYRPAGGRFRFSTALRCRPLTVPNAFPSVVSAAGDGRAVLVTVTRTADFKPYTLLVQTGRDGHFGAPHILARSRTDFNFGAPAIGLGGTVTIAWETCRRYVIDCVVGAARGSLRNGLWPTRSFSDPGNRYGLGGRVGDGYVTLQRCAGPRCALSVAYATRRGFTSPQPITSDGVLSQPDDLVAASGGRARVRLLVWETSHDALLAATLNSRSGRFGPPHLLGAWLTRSGHVTYETGPAGQAIVTWTNPDGTASAATYTR